MEKNTTPEVSFEEVLNVNRVAYAEMLWSNLNVIFICVITSVITSCIVLAFKAPYVEPAKVSAATDPKSITVNAAQLQQLTDEHEKLIRVVTALVLQSRDGSLKVPAALIRDPSPYVLVSEIKEKSVLLSVKPK